MTQCVTVRFKICTLHDIYDGMCGKCSIHERNTDISTKFLGAPAEKRTLEWDMYTWEENIKMNLEQLGWKVWTVFLLFTKGFGS